MARENHDDGLAFEVIEIHDLKPCPFLPGPFPERVTARCTCCGDVMEVFIDMRTVEHDGGRLPSTQIATTGTAHYLAKSASSVGLDGMGGWLLIRSPRRHELPAWVCRDCAQIAIDDESEEVADAVAWWLRWARVEVEDKIAESPRRWGRR